MFPTIIDYLFPGKPTNRKDLSVYNHTKHELRELWEVRGMQ